MSNFGLRTFALNMNEEISTLGKLALTADTPSAMTAFPTGGEQPQQLPQMPMGGQPQPAAPQAPVPNQQSAFVPPTIAAVPPPAETPSQPVDWGNAGDPSPLFNQLEQQNGLPSGTLMHLYGLESSYGQNLKNPNSSASGPFQFISSTARQYGLTPESVMQLEPSAAAAASMAGKAVPKLTETLGRPPTIGEIYLAHQQGLGGAVGLLSNPDARAVDIVGRPAVVQNGGDENMTAGQFASLWTSKVPGQPSGTMSSRNSTPPFFPTNGELPIDTSDLEEDMEDMSPEARRRRHQGAMLMGIGQGLTQISRGQPADMSSVMDSYYARQSEARDRMAEIAQERRRQQEYNNTWDRQITLQTMQENQQIRSEERAEGAAIRSEERADERTERNINAAQGLYGDLVPNAGEYFRVGGMDAVKDAAERTRATQSRQQTVSFLQEYAANNPDDPLYTEVANFMAGDPTLTMEKAFDLVQTNDPAEIKEFKFFKGLDDAGKQEFLKYKQSGASTFNMGDTISTVGAKEAFNQLGKDREALRAQQPAYEAYRTLAALSAAHPDGQIPSGALDSLTLDARRYLNDVGLLSPDQELTLDLQMAFNSLGSRLIGGIRIPGTGSTSDLEFGEFMKNVAKIDKPEVVNQIMTQIGLSTYKYNEQLTNLKEAYIVEHGNTVGFDKMVDEKEKDGSLQATFYSASNEQAMQNAIVEGNLKPGDLIQDENGAFKILTEEGLQYLMGDDNE